MALYRRGTASMDADGTVHGTDTKWKDQLALIRVGATIVFLEQPIKLAVISDIVSDTELKAISTDGQTAANGKYVILLNDSLTVNGLAQNVAETLRYYQSKETEIAGAMDIIASLDMDNLNRIVEEIKANKSAAESAQNQAELARDSANAARDEANDTKGQVQQIVDGSVGSINAAKEQAIKDVGAKESAAITHIDTEEKAAIKAINDTKGDLSGYVNNAQSAAQTATSAKNDAQAARDAAASSKDAAAVSAQEAKDAASSVDAKNLLHKNNNLSDVADKSKTRENLSLGENDVVNFKSVQTTNFISIQTKLNEQGNNPSSPFISTLVDSDGNIIGRVELRSDNNGTISLINRSGSAPQFLTLNKNGVMTVGGVTTGQSRCELDGPAVVLKNKTQDDSLHLIAQNKNGANRWYVGNGSRNSDTVTLHNYIRGCSIDLGTVINLGGKDTHVANLVVNGSSIYVKGGEGASNTHVWFQNKQGRNRGVIYAADNQIINIRGDNGATGSAGISTSFNGANGEWRAAKFTQTSDERAKFWIKGVESALDKICSLKGVTFSMHTTKQNTVRSAGVIAQDVQKVLPEAVSVNENSDHGIIDKECNVIENPLGVDYAALSALYVEAIKELKVQVEDLKEEIKSLKEA